MFLVFSNSLKIINNHIDVKLMTYFNLWLYTDWTSQVIVLDDLQMVFHLLTTKAFRII